MSSVEDEMARMTPAPPTFEQACRRAEEAASRLKVAIRDLRQQGFVVRIVTTDSRVFGTVVDFCVELTKVVSQMEEPGRG